MFYITNHMTEYRSPIELNLKWGLLQEVFLQNVLVKIAVSTAMPRSIDIDGFTRKTRKGQFIENLCNEWEMLGTTTTSMPKLLSSVCGWIRDS